MSDQPPFSPRVLAIWIGLAAVLSAIALYFMAQGDAGRAEDPIGPTTASRSALGYAGIADILDRIGTPVIRSRSRSVERAGKDGVLIVAEPRLSGQSMRAAEHLLDAPTVLIILPKWDGKASDAHKGWIGQAEMAPWLEPQMALALVDAKGSVARGPAVTKWSHNAIGPMPMLADPMQFVRSKVLKPIVARGDEILVGEVKRQGRRIWVLADPDVIANHGLSQPANADFAVALIGALRTSDGPVVFDEAIHGVAGSSPTIVGLLFRFPFIVTTILTLIATALLLWATTIRFGAAEPAAPALDSGKQGLIANTAALIAMAGRRAVIVQRFVDAAIRDVARQLYAPRGLPEPALVDWLARVGRTRGIDVDCAAMVARAHAIAESGGKDEAALVAVARDINRWKQGMTDGH